MGRGSGNLNASGRTVVHPGPLTAIDASILPSDPTCIYLFHPLLKTKLFRFHFFFLARQHFCSDAGLRRANVSLALASLSRPSRGVPRSASRSQRQQRQTAGEPWRDEAVWSSCTTICKSRSLLLVFSAGAAFRGHFPEQSLLLAAAAAARQRTAHNRSTTGLAAITSRGEMLIKMWTYSKPRGTNKGKPPPPRRRPAFEREPSTRMPKWKTTGFRTTVR